MQERIRLQTTLRHPGVEAMTTLHLHVDKITKHKKHAKSEQ